jgi:hypothetical protein
LKKWIKILHGGMEKGLLCKISWGEANIAIKPWWNMSLGPSLKWVGIFINLTKELEKIHKYT